MTNFYQTSDDVAILKERIEELSRIRQGYAVQLGSSLYDVTKDDPNLRWGRESLYMGIADCDEERAQLCERIARLEAAEDLQSGVAEAQEDTSAEEEPVPESIAEVEVIEEEVLADELGDTVVVTIAEDVAEAEPEAEAQPEPDPVVEPEPIPEPEPVIVEPEPASVAEPVAIPVPQPEPVPAPVAAGPVCPNCGAPVSAGDKFCMECGSSLQVAPQPKVCPSCGNPVDPSFKFCMSCGHKLS